MRAGNCSKLLFAAVLVCRAALAQPAPSARDLFDRGLELARKGDLDAAAAQFEEAFRTSPNYGVLYNLGQAYVGLGKPVEAVRTLEKFLELGGATIDPSRRREVQDLIRLNKKRIGYLSFRVEPPDAEVFVDGRSEGKGAGREPIALVAGPHGVTATTNGYTSFARNIEVARESTTALTIELQSEKQPLAPTKLGQLAVECPVPDTSVLLDGAAPPRVGIDPFLVPVGSHQVNCARDGYAPLSSQTEVTEQGVARVVCDLKVMPRLPTSESGLLTFVVGDSGAEVTIDGQRSPPTTRLPSGPHRVLVQRWGFEDWTQTVVARPGFPETISVRLQPTPEHALALSDAARARRTWAYVYGGAGLALLGSAVAIYVDDNHRYSNWKQDRDALSRDIQAQHWSPALSERAGTLQSEAASIQGRDDLAIGGAVLGGALLSYAVVSWFSAQQQ